MSTPVTLEPPPQTADRGRAWRLLGLVALLVALYLALWIAYTNGGLVRYSRMVQLAPGANAHVNGADFRVLSIVQTPVLLDQAAYPDAIPLDPGTVWVIAEVEVTLRTREENFVCTVELMGPDRRRWDAASAPAVRTIPTFCDKDDLVPDRPFRYAPIFSVPAANADQLVGLVVVNADEPIPVLRPPA